MIRYRRDAKPETRNDKMNQAININFLTIVSFPVLLKSHQFTFVLVQWASAGRGFASFGPVFRCILSTA